MALLPGGTTRAATVRARTDVSLLVLDRANFENLLGPLLPQLEAAAKNYAGYKSNKQGVQVGASTRRVHAQNCPQNPNPFCCLNLRVGPSPLTVMITKAMVVLSAIVSQDLVLSECQQLATLGAGGFGRVTLVRYRGSSYALKQMSKGHIIDNKLVAHVHREKKVRRIAHTSVQGLHTCKQAKKHAGGCGGGGSVTDCLA